MPQSSDKMTCSKPEAKKRHQKEGESAAWGDIKVEVDLPAHCVYKFDSTGARRRGSRTSKQRGSRSDPSPAGDRSWKIIIKKGQLIEF